MSRPLNRKGFLQLIEIILAALVILLIVFFGRRFYFSSSSLKGKIILDEAPFKDITTSTPQGAYEGIKENLKQIETLQQQRLKEMEGFEKR